MNVCGCGAQAGYPHAPACPYPLFRGSEQDWDKWERALGVRMAELEKAGK
jgi:hypothetical protein